MFKLYAILGPGAYWYPAPFGRYGSESVLSIDGKIAWVIQEIVGPITFLYYLWASVSVKDLDTWKLLVAAMFVGHYINRSLIWPLRMMPSISRNHM